MHQRILSAMSLFERKWLFLHNGALLKPLDVFSVDTYIWIGINTLWAGFNPLTTALWVLNIAKICCVTNAWYLTI
ncbi:MAG: hypothetical protein ACI8XG_000960 [Congregibacter sp.]|jgi:hypothetical protein